MRTIVKFYQMQFRLGKIDDVFLSEKVQEDKITNEEKSIIMS